MNDFLIILIVLATFAGGYFFMGKLDRFLTHNFRNEPPEYQQRRPCSMLLSDSLNDEELIRAIRRFSAEHEQTVIILRDSMPEDAGVNTD